MTCPSDLGLHAVQALAIEERSPAEVLFKYQLLSDVMDDFLTTAERHATAIIDTMCE